MSSSDNPEIEILSTDEANERAKKHIGTSDPFPVGGPEGVPASLLSADHIEQYVLKTGMIAPFFLGGGRKERLKKASYEGRIGKKAFVFDQSNGLVPILKPTEPLVIPANSIVFVESDLEFRLPHYIALRFNLQIQHVHRGLLLGTGPLVDPGFWGKLCIPLHNLTDEPYAIPLKEGLFWVEFTKTTSDSKLGRITLSEGEGHKEHWEIEKFLWRAAGQYDPSQPSIGIRSSIPEVGRKTSEDARMAAQDAKQAREAASQAQTDAQAARQSTLVLQVIGTLAAAAVAVAAFSLWATYVGITDAGIATIKIQADQIQKRIEQIETSSVATKIESDMSLQLGTRLNQIEFELQQLQTQQLHLIDGVGGKSETDETDTSSQDKPINLAE